MRFKVLDNGRVQDLVQGVDFDPRKQKNRIAALRFKEQGDNQLMDIINRIDASEKNQAKKQQRLAGDGIAALKEAAPKDKSLGPAYEHLLEKAAEFNAIDSNLMQAGVPASQFAGMQRLQVPELVGNVPAPYVTKASNGNERRIHLVRDDSSELHPIQNNNPNSNGYLVSEFGSNVDLEGEDKASEYVQDHILRLMGYNPQRGPKGKVDFYVEENGQRIGIDGQVQEEGRAPVVEAFTKVMPNDRAGRHGDGGGYGYGYARNQYNPNGTNTLDNVNAIRNDVRLSLTHAMKEGRTFDEAMQFLMNEGYIADARGPQGQPQVAGKLYKADYDRVLMPIQNKEQNRQNRRNDDIAIAPEAVVQYNMEDIKKEVKGIRDPRKIINAYNAGNNGKGKARVKLRAEVPSQHVHDVVEEYPYVGQMLRELQYK